MLESMLLSSRAHASDSRADLTPEKGSAETLNSLLPGDIVVLSVQRERPDFHARHDAVARAYLYQISTRKTALEKKHVWWIRRTVGCPCYGESGGPGCRAS